MTTRDGTHRCPNCEHGRVPCDEGTRLGPGRYRWTRTYLTCVRCGGTGRIAAGLAEAAGLADAPEQAQGTKARQRGV